MPGITNFPLQSAVAAPAGAFSSPAGPTQSMRPSTTTIAAFESADRPVPSIRVKFLPTRVSARQLQTAIERTATCFHWLRIFSNPIMFACSTLLRLSGLRPSTAGLTPCAASRWCCASAQRPLVSSSPASSPCYPLPRQYLSRNRYVQALAVRWNGEPLRVAAPGTTFNSLQSGNEYAAT